jgi:hypothetical protein
MAIGSVLWRKTGEVTRIYGFYGAGEEGAGKVGKAGAAATKVCA